VGQLFPGRLAGGVRLLTVDTVAHRPPPDIGQARPGPAQQQQQRPTSPALFGPN
jgi:hypothetical protein